jgi:hypothetical protein
MPRNAEKGRFHRAAAAIKRVFTRRHDDDPAPAETGRGMAGRETQRELDKVHVGRPTHRPSDVGVDVLSQAYSPRDTSGKAGFRSTGADHQRDQDFAPGAGNDTWKDEDRLTNKSNDPRIGTHGRTYEPGESRDESRSE